MWVHVLVFVSSLSSCASIVMSVWNYAYKIKKNFKKNEMLMYEKLPSQVWEFSAENCPNGSQAKVVKFHTNPVACLYPIHTNSLF